MKRIQLPRSGTAAFLPTLSILLFSVFSAHGAEASSHPNIVFILTDDMGWGDLGCYGSKQAPTPSLDGFAAAGTRFTQFYCAAPICSPSRVAYTTGMFPARWRINSYLHERAENARCEQVDWLDVKAPTLARTLKAAGYATGHFGKWHMGGGRDVQDAPEPSAYGFDEHFVNFEGMGPRIDGSLSALFEGRELPRHKFTEMWVDKTIGFIKKHKDKPFFVNLWPMDVHNPFIPAPNSAEAFPAQLPKQQRNFRAVLREYDRQMGRVFAALNELGLDKNTIVVFTSDNGPDPSFEHVRSGGLRGMKKSLYEGGIRMPFIVRWPGHVPAGQTNEATVLAAVDLFPSLCKLAGVAPPKNLDCDGEDLSAALLGATPARQKALFWEYGRNNESYVFAEGKDRSPNVAMRDGRWKLLVNAEGTRVELYDLIADPKETTNLADKEKEIAAKLRQAALEWRKSLPKFVANP
jgi:arylsulfatase A-like enzyme